jgi:hypothetical protein
METPSRPPLALSMPARRRLMAVKAGVFCWSQCSHPMISGCNWLKQLPARGRPIRPKIAVFAYFSSEIVEQGRDDNNRPLIGQSAIIDAIHK